MGLWIGFRIGFERGLIGFRPALGRNIGALTVTKTIVGVPYDLYRMIYPPKPYSNN